MIAANLGAMFSKDAKVPPIQKFFPHLFDDEGKVHNTEQKPEKGKLSKAEMSFLQRMIEEQSRRNQLASQSKQDNKG